MKALIAEDDAVLRRALMLRLGSWGFETAGVEDGEQAWAALSRDDGPRLAILDWKMPRMDGLEVCRRVRAQGLEPYVYLLLLTGRQAKDDVVAGLAAGADDYLSKPFVAQELNLRLQIGQRIVGLQSEIVKAREAFRAQANLDALTGLLSRGALMQGLDLEAARAQREGTSLAVILCDLDHFKAVNDGFGHPAGDAVLRETASRLRSKLRPYDALGRYGGEELMAVLPGCDAAEATVVAERLRRALRETPVFHGGRSIPVTASFGVAAAAGTLADGASLIYEADRALYAAKRAGRDRVAIAGQPLESLLPSERCPVPSRPSLFPRGVALRDSLPPSLPPRRSQLPAAP